MFVQLSDGKQPKTSGAYSHYKGISRILRRIQTQSINFLPKKRIGSKSSRKKVTTIYLGNTKLSTSHSNLGARHFRTNISKSNVIQKTAKQSFQVETSNKALQVHNTVAKGIPALELIPTVGWKRGRFPPRQV